MLLGMCCCTLGVIVSATKAGNNMLLLLNNIEPNNLRNLTFELNDKMHFYLLLNYCATCKTNTSCVFSLF